MSRTDPERRLPRLDDDLDDEGALLADEEDITGAVIRGHFVGAELHFVGLRECRLSEPPSPGAS